MARRRAGTLIAPVLRIVIRALSPIIKKGLEDSIRNLYNRALETENEIDDIFVELLADLLDIEL